MLSFWQCSSLVFQEKSSEAEIRTRSKECVFVQKPLTTLPFPKSRYSTAVSSKPLIQNSNIYEKKFFPKHLRISFPFSCLRVITLGIIEKEETGAE